MHYTQDMWYSTNISYPVKEFILKSSVIFMLWTKIILLWLINQSSKGKKTQQLIIHATLLPLGLSKYCVTTTIDTCVPDEASQSKSPKSKGNYRLTVNIPVCNCLTTFLIQFFIISSEADKFRQPQRFRACDQKT